MESRSGNTKTSKSGRPAAFDRSDAVEAAMNLFWRNGYLAVSAKDLANAMAIQRSSFYNSFGSREAVFKEALDLYGTRSPDAVLADIHAGDPVIPAIVSLLRNVCRIRADDVEARGCLVCNSVAELVGVDREAGALLEQVLSDRIALLKGLLRQAVRQKELPGDTDTSTVANSLIAFLMGLNLLSKVERDERRLWAACRVHLAGMGIHPDPE
jgi:TetR/AcrR family transcriptional repressor of nem operon